MLWCAANSTASLSADDAKAIADAYLYAAGYARASLTRAVCDAITAIEELRSGLEQAE